MDQPTILGMIGVSGILGAYFLNLFNKIDQNSYAYILINLIGASLACLSSIMIKSIPFTILEGTWSLVSLIALIRKWANPITSMYLLIPLAMLLSQCSVNEQPAEQKGLQALMANTESLGGRSAYLNSPFVTAGDRLYMVGHQNGQFPDLGWHVQGEMGGIWDHPIKLMDGFTAILYAEDTYCLAQADSFINYPFANKHLYSLPSLGLQVERFQFVPDGKEAVVVEYTFINKDSKVKKIGFEFTGFSDLRPVWLGERTGMVDGKDAASWYEEDQVWVMKDSLNDWYALFGSSQKGTAQQSLNLNCAYHPQGQGASASLRFDLEIPAESRIIVPFTIAGSSQSLALAKATYQEVQIQASVLLNAKKERYQKITEQTKLSIPDPQLETAFRWVKYNTDWLIRDVPEIGRGLAAGLPDYPWWFGVDNEYTLQGALATGRTDLVYSTINLLVQLSQKTNGDNGRIVHEVSTNGAVFNPGNVNETPQFASLIHAVYQWTGDKAFLTKYYPTVKLGLDWLLKENDADGNLLPDGFGMMEIHGLNSEMIDVAVYSQQAFADAAELAEVMGEPEVAANYKQLADQLKQKINTDFWVPEYNSYADFIGTTEQALHLIEDAIVRADTLGKPWAVEELKATKAKIAALPPKQKQGFVLHHNWVVNTPMEMGIADSAKAIIALETGSRFVNPFGMFVTGIDRDETAGSDEGSFAATKKIFSYTGAVMTLPTGVQAIAENNYGRPDQALDYLQRMTRSFGYALPGSIYEVSPDFGMMTQAWNLYSYAIPIVTQFFGVQPDAAGKRIRIQPQMPSTWPEASLENVLIANNSIDLNYEQQEESVQLDISQTQPNWTLEVAFPSGKYTSWEVNGKLIMPSRVGTFDVLEIRDNKVELKLK